jgi:hypothetical protein
VTAVPPGYYAEYSERETWLFGGLGNAAAGRALPASQHGYKWSARKRQRASIQGRYFSGIFFFAMGHLFSERYA